MKNDLLYDVGILKCICCLYLQCPFHELEDLDNKNMCFGFNENFHYIKRANMYLWRQLINDDLSDGALEEVQFDNGVIVDKSLVFYHLNLILSVHLDLRFWNAKYKTWRFTHSSTTVHTRHPKHFFSVFFKERSQSTNSLLANWQNRLFVHYWITSKW